MSILPKMLRDPGLRFRKFIFLPNSVLNFGKITKFGGNWPKNKKVTDKEQFGGGKHPPPPSAYRVKLIERVKIAHSFLQSVSDQLYIIILSLPM